MVGRFWSFSVEPARAAEVQECLDSIALPAVRGQIGCQAVFALREPLEPGRFAWLAFWVSRKAMDVSLASGRWRELREKMAGLGVSLDESEARSFETIATFFAGGSSRAGDRDEESSG